MSNKLLKHAGIAVMLCSALAGSVMAQTDPWIANEISRQNQRNLEADNRIRAQRAREGQLQREIAELRRTPFYQAIGYDFSTRQAMWGGGGYSSEKRAVEETLKLCPSSNCQIVASFANTCAMIAFPKGGGRSPSEIFVGLDNDPQQAIMKSGLACEAKFGYDKCSISTMKTKTGNALCSGYDYSIYGQK